MGGDRETAIMFYSPLFCIPTRGESGAVFQPLKSLSEIMASGGAMNALMTDYLWHPNEPASGDPQGIPRTAHVELDDPRE